MSTAEPTNEAHNLNSMPEDVLRAILARARFDDQAALKRVCKRFLAVITSRAFREERRASGCLDEDFSILDSDLCLRRRGRCRAVLVRGPTVRRAGRHGVGRRDPRIGSDPND